LDCVGEAGLHAMREAESEATPATAPPGERPI